MPPHPPPFFQALHRHVDLQSGKIAGGISTACAGATAIRRARQCKNAEGMARTVPPLAIRDTVWQAPICLLYVLNRFDRLDFSMRFCFSLRFLYGGAPITKRLYRRIVFSLFALARTLFSYFYLLRSASLCVIPCCAPMPSLPCLLLNTITPAYSIFHLLERLPHTFIFFLAYFRALLLSQTGKKIRFVLQTID